jgi:hypothetical protein
VIVAIVLVVVWCCLEWITGWRYSVFVHSASLFLWAGPREMASPRGRFVSTGTLARP